MIGRSICRFSFFPLSDSFILKSTVKLVEKSVISSSLWKRGCYHLDKSQILRVTFYKSESMDSGFEKSDAENEISQEFWKQARGDFLYFK